MFNRDANELMLGRQRPHSRGAYAINRSTYDTTTHGADYGEAAMRADSYYDVLNTLKRMLHRCKLVQATGRTRRLPGMARASSIEIDLLRTLLIAADRWYCEPMSKEGKTDD